MRVAILVSGRGSNMAALIDAAKEPGFPAEIVAVISNRPTAGALDIAAGAGIATAVVDHKKFPSREAFDEALDAELRGHRPDIICMAGFMRLLTPGFISKWEGRMLNIHPALLPSFKGLDTHARALEAGVRLHGCTVHLVTAEMDAGPIVAQAAAPVLDGDDEAALAARVLKAEHKLYVHALKAWADGRARLAGDRVVWDRAVEAPEALIWP
ncbi:phosphoribosylglycinamide formyltransferase [Chenggangzhangella methanolivorans]|uniref:phosphoribosylglycinamide formyltransferase n=1 Tax=Chenggangzhangella methanolivorans TaxID=1437009 RepID=UPI003621EE37